MRKGAEHQMKDDKTSLSQEFRTHSRHARQTSLLFFASSGWYTRLGDCLIAALFVMLI
jgi:hypothetical protein